MGDISLCNVVYKIIANTIANRLKKMLPIIIYEARSGFVSNRLITYNAIIVFEVFHWIQKRRSGGENMMAIKLDMSKAYERVEWDFLKWMLDRLYFPSHVSSLIMHYVKSISFQVLINGKSSEHFKWECGLRQDDLLSPFLFARCAEGLSGLIRKEVANKKIRGTKIGMSELEISHLFFADDSLLFAHGMVENATVLKKTIEL